MKRSPWKKKLPQFEEGKWNGFKRSPMKRSTKPMNKVGKQGKINAKADRESKKILERADITCCQLCGRNIGLGRSHSNKRRYESDLVRVALLCNFPCHNFIEHKLDSNTRKAVNDFIIDTDLEGLYKFDEVVKLIPEEKRAKFISAIMTI